MLPEKKYLYRSLAGEAIAKGRNHVEDQNDGNV